jgi:uncharacterized Ntn-hydrolase superfamily protein
MTFTILGRNPQSGQLGIAIATYSLAVGATCPKILPGAAVLTSQASTNPAIGEEIISLLQNGSEPSDAFHQSISNDSHPDYRQVALLTPTGNALVHSGTNIKPASGHVGGNNCVAVGNFLANETVLQAVVTGFENTNHNPTSLADQLIAALAAGKEAGGQAATDGTHLPERSASLLIATPNEKFPIDIRIDSSTNAITDLQSAINAYQPMHPYYLQRAKNPTNLPPQNEWIT